MDPKYLTIQLPICICIYIYISAVQNAMFMNCSADESLDFLCSRHFCGHTPRLVCPLAQSVFFPFGRSKKVVKENCPGEPLVEKLCAGEKPDALLPAGS